MRFLHTVLAFLCVVIMLISAEIVQYSTHYDYISTCGKMMILPLVSWCTRTLTVPVDVDGLRVGAPYSEALLDDLLDFWEVGLQGLVAEHFGKHLERWRKRHVVSFIIPNVTTLV